ncbi:hypothetical protein [Brevundimonas mediterranea]|jgi:hypothetical protein|uniref:REJ domain-containing protein n=1 Tax=Brevundimonas mediterranea TaxID=74329 RepID=A0A7Z8Y5P6_9CAUL|nr:hypothetical protein [Brevundimonas mediterranea]VDC51417.1 hypothetical protein BREV_BREV_00486 [Brevundimonas mediterranea]
MATNQGEIDELKARLARLESNGATEQIQPGTAVPKASKAGRPVGAIVAFGVVGLVAVVLAIAWNSGKHSDERDDLAMRLARIGGNQTCNIGWLKATDQGLADGRTPSIFAPEVRVVGPPRVLSCPMIRTGGVEAEPLIVFERCRDVDMDCVDLAP